MKEYSPFFLLLLLSSFLSHSHASWQGQGEVALEYRHFEDDDNSKTEDIDISLFTRLDTKYDGDILDMAFRGYGRVSEKEEGRNILRFEDAYFRFPVGPEGDWSLYGGYKTYNWTATEAFHPADAVNSRNLDSEFENFEKMGELSVELEIPVLRGTFSLFYWPRFEEPHFPGERSRLGSGTQFDRAVVLNSSDVNENAKLVPQYGARFANVWGDADFSLHVIRHIDRNYPLLGDINYTQVNVLGEVTTIPSKQTLTPYYFEATQIGGTLAHVWDALITKVEFAWRDFDSIQRPVYNALIKQFLEPKDHQEVAVGFEYLLAHDSGVESYLILEGNTFFGLTTEERAAISVFQRDVLLGYRLNLNDDMGREFFFSTILDVERTHERFFQASYSQRLNDAWKMRLALRVFDAKSEAASAVPTGLELFNKDNYLQLTLSRFF